MLTTASLLAVLILTLILFFAGFTSLTKQVREKHAPHASATQNVTADQQPRELVLATASLLAVLIFTLVLFFAGFTSLTKQMRNEQIAQTSTAQQPAADQ